MRQARLGDTPMLANELGWYTSGPPGPLLTTQGERADRIRQVVAAAEHTDCNLVALGIHSWVTDQADPADAEDWYGLADPRSGAPNQSGLAYGSAIEAASQSRMSPAAESTEHLCG
jgi:hypothetical protein